MRNFLFRPRFNVTHLLTGNSVCLLFASYHFTGQVSEQAMLAAIVIVFGLSIAEIVTYTGDQEDE